jgi:hypothetical protein
MSVSRHVTVGAVHAVAMPERVMGVGNLYQKNHKGLLNIIKLYGLTGRGPKWKSNHRSLKTLKML